MAVIAEPSTKAQNLASALNTNERTGRGSGHTIVADEALLEEYRYKVQNGYIHPSDLVAELLKEGLSPQLAESVALQVMPDRNVPAPIYAGFLVRLAAWFFDALAVVALVLGILFLVAAIWPSGSDTGRSLFTTNLNLVYLATWTVYSMITVGLTGTSFGKYLLSLRVADEGTLRRPSVPQAIGRSLGYLLSSILSLGFLAIAFSDKKQGLHDQLASTVVLHGPISWRKKVLLGALFLLVFSSYAWLMFSHRTSGASPGSSTPSADISAVTSEWKSFSDPDGVYSAEYPAPPVAAAAPLNVGSYLVDGTYYAVRTETGEYGVFEGPLTTTDAESVIDEFAQALPQNTEVVYSTERLTGSAGVRALDYSVKFHGHQTSGRLFVSGSHVLMALVIDETDQGRIDHFIKSIRILRL